MEAKKYLEMIHDHHFFDLKKMEYKYSKEDVQEMIGVMKEMVFKELPLSDFAGKTKLVYADSLLTNSSQAAKKLLQYQGNAQYGLQSLEEEILSTFSIEQIDTSRESVRRILAGRAPEDEQEMRILGMKRGFEFISCKENKINAHTLRELYEISINPYLSWKEDKLNPSQFYRNDDVSVVNKLDKKKIHKGLAAELIPEKMNELLLFIEREQKMDDLAKAAVIHFYIGYIHPYFDGNGRMARLVHSWYLLQKGYSSTLFLPFSSLILKTKVQYNKAYELTEKNAEISGVIDITPFLNYFNENVYRQIGQQQFHSTILEQFHLLLQSGRITEKEKDLFQYVLSSYGYGEFSTKQLERDFGNCAYATIRTFVMKLTAEKLLEEHVYGNKKKYSITRAQEPEHI